MSGSTGGVPLCWQDSQTVDEEGLGFDSLARLALVSRLNDYFHLSETGVEDYLLVERRLGDWLRLVSHSTGQTLGSAQEPRGTLTFRTGGTSGDPIPVTHKLADLVAEMRAQIRHLPPHSRIVSRVPPHHIYGFLFTVLLAELGGVETIDISHRAPGAVLQVATEGDLVVSTPFLWDLDLAAGARFPAGINGLTSTAPAPAVLWERVAAAGLESLTEIYGATQTAGIGWRRSGAASFCLLDHLRRAPDGAILREGSDAPLPVQDRLEWDDEGQFRPTGRTDGAVQVGGVNVFPESVARRLSELEDVIEVAVRLDTRLGRLKAFVVPDSDADREALARALRDLCHRELTAPERPVRFDMGDDLPRSLIGKLADW